jgi:hypothetical protein
VQRAALILVCSSHSHPVWSTLIHSYVWLVGSAASQAALCLPITILWLSSEQILLAAGQSAEIASAAAHFVRVALVGLPGYFLFEVGRRYLQAMSIVKPLLVVGGWDGVMVWWRCGVVRVVNLI